MTGFGASSLDFTLEFDVKSDAWQKVFDTRHAVLTSILERFNELGIAFAYPTQTSYTTAPDGTLIYPFPAEQPASPAPQPAPRRKGGGTSATD
jgi:small-conductance mechanosensitive channel